MSKVKDLTSNLEAWVRQNPKRAAIIGGVLLGVILFLAL